MLGIQREKGWALGYQRDAAQSKLYKVAEGGVKVYISEMGTDADIRSRPLRFCSPDIGVNSPVSSLILELKR
jgi:hypothetical protein